MHVLIAALSRFQQPTGICRYAANLARCLNDADHIGNVTVAVGEWQTDYFQRCFAVSGPKISMLSVPIANSVLERNSWYTIGLPRLARRLRPDLVHLGYPTPILPCSFPVPVVATVHDLYPFEFSSGFRGQPSLLKQALFRMTLANADAIACVSATTAEALRRRFPRLASRKPVSLICNYAQLAVAGNTQRLETLGRLRAPFILSVAQHRPNKRLHLLIEAFHKLRQSTAPNIMLAIVGSPETETGRLNALAARLGIESQISWLHSVSDAALACLYQNCAAYVCPSAVEGFCLPVLEARLFSRAVVCSDIPALREVGGPDCYYFDSKGDEGANLAGTINTAMMARQLPAAALSFFKQRTLRECLAVYETLLPARVLTSRELGKTKAA
jgi:glycosyltransferase involved in cell wall biosynthesis